MGAYLDGDKDDARNDVGEGVFWRPLNVQSGLDGHVVMVQGVYAQVVPLHGRLGAGRVDGLHEEIVVGRQGD